MESLHILLICPESTEPVYAKQTGTLAFALKSCGLKVSILVGEQKGSPLEGMSKDIKVYYTPERPKYKFWDKPLANRMQRLLMEDESIDICQLMQVKFPYTQTAKAATKIGVPIIGRIQKAKHIDKNTVPYWQRNSFIESLHLFKPLIAPNSGILSQTRLNSLADVVLISDGVDTQHFKPVLSKRPLRRNLGLPEKGTLICCMANIKKSNAQIETLKRCLPLSENLQLLFIGDVVEKEYLANLEREAQLQDVKDFVHIITTPNNPAEYMKASDLFMLLGGIENRHNTLLEAQSSGLPIIISPCEDALTLTNGGKSGIVLDNSEDAKRKFRKLLTDPTYRQGLSVEARPFVRKKYDFKEMVHNYIRLYEKL